MRGTAQRVWPSVQQHSSRNSRHTQAHCTSSNSRGRIEYCKIRLLSPGHGVDTGEPSSKDVPKGSRDKLFGYILSWPERLRDSTCPWVYLNIISPRSCWKSHGATNTVSPILIQTLRFILPRIRQTRVTPSAHSTRTLS